MKVGQHHTVETLQAMSKALKLIGRERSLKAWETKRLRGTGKWTEDRKLEHKRTRTLLAADPKWRQRVSLATANAWTDELRQEQSDRMAKKRADHPEIMVKQMQTNLERYGRADGPVKDTKPELLVKKKLEELQINFLPQQPVKGIIVDFYLQDTKTCLFVDGCYWHGCPKHHPSRIRSKDLSDNQKLIDSDHKVVRVWECDVVNGLYTLLGRV